ncbi:hypothetical protein GCM10009682_30180 [Luedemannella flava]|uniref:Uncharacterized protein n=1 Tax=Luedemannella flava TaxID=349316 RepID=A0ABP4YDA9_9ACTN
MSAACLGDGSITLTALDDQGRPTGVRVSTDCDVRLMGGEFSGNGWGDGPFWIMPSLSGAVTAWEVFVTESKARRPDPTPS